MFLVLLSFIIDPYNWIQLTAIAIITGKNNIFWSSKDSITKKIDFVVPNAIVIIAIVYPRLNPLYNINPNTTGSPITVVPKKPN